MSKAEKVMIWIGALTLLAALLVVPEFRQWTGLEKVHEDGPKPESLRFVAKPTPLQIGSDATIRTQLPTDGLWLDDLLRADDKQVFLELLPKGKVRVRFGVDGRPLMSADTWYETGETIHVTEFLGNATIECEGKLKGDVIEGTRHEVNAGQLSSPSPWNMQRVRNEIR